jgi:hypothetical protein
VESECRAAANRHRTVAVVVLPGSHTAAVDVLCQRLGVSLIEVYNDTPQVFVDTLRPSAQHIKAC